MSVPSEVRCEKPPDYETVATLMPPSYDDAIKLNPGAFLAQSPPSTSSASVHLPTTIVEHERERKQESPASGGNSSTPPIYTITTVMPNEVLTPDNEQSFRAVPSSRAAPAPR